MSILPETLGGKRDNVWNNLFHILNKGVNPNRYPLLKHCLVNKPDRILEIGYGTGENAKYLYKLSNPDRYIVVDILEELEGCAALERTRWENLVRMLEWKGFDIKVGNSRDILPKINGPFDLIFIDGCPEYEVVKEDWENSKEMMHKDTTVFFHDYENSEGVTRCFDEIPEDEFDKRTFAPKAGGPKYGIVKKKEG